MKVNKLAACCALAFASISGSSMAAMTAGEIAIVEDALKGDDGNLATPADERVIFISGASATQKGFTSIISTMFTGTPIRFAVNTTATSRDYEAAAGVLAAGTGTWAGKNAIIIYRVKGGSVWGVNPVARNEAIDSLDVKGTCGSTVGSNGSAAMPYNCGVNTRKPDAGVSDVAPALFQSPYNTESDISDEPNAVAALDPTELANFNAPGSINPVYGLAFGVPITDNLPMFNLNKNAVSAIMAGNLASWNLVDSTLPAEDVVICRRVPGSGTQAVDNLYFGNYPCGDTLVNVPADRYISGAWDDSTRTYTVANGAGGVIVVENSTSGDVAKCLDQAVTGGTYNTADRAGVTGVTVDFGAGGYKAIGVLSMDSLSKSKTTGNWQFRSLDGSGTITWDNTAVAPVTSNGVAPYTAGTGTGKFPTKASLMDGTWDLMGQISFNIPKRTPTDFPAKAGVLAKFLSNAKSPAILAAITDLKNVAGSPAGTSDPTATGNVLRSSYLAGNQCGPRNRNN